MDKVLKSTRYVRITDDTCRICLREMLDKKVLKSFDQSLELPSGNQTLGYVFERCTGYITAYGPQQVCLVCEASLLKFYHFRCEIDQAEETLISALNPTRLEETTCDEIIEEEHQEVEEEDVPERGFEEFEEPEAEEVQPVQQMSIEDYCDQEKLVLIATQDYINVSTICDVCQKNFSTVSHMKQHRKIHFNIKDFQCHYCNREFTTRSQLNAHLKSHTEERNFECDECDKKFKTKKTLAGHKETHMTERTFTCDWCTHACTNKTALRVHIFRQHRPIIPIKKLGPEDQEFEYLK